MPELEDKIDRLESEITQIKIDIREVLVDLREVMYRHRNPLSGPLAEAPVEAAT